MTLKGLAGRVAAVTGGGNGIGEATVRRLAAEGCYVVVVDIDKERATTVAASLETKAIGVAADISTEEGVDRFVAAAVEAFGRLDLLHNNAGIADPPVPITEIVPADFDKVIAVNTRGVFLGMQRAMRQMIRQGSGGAIVNTSALAGLTGFRHQGSYVAAKHAVIGLTSVAATEGAGFGIRVNAVCPGLIGTETVKSLLGPEGIKQFSSLMPMGRPGTPDELAATVAWLLSDEAAYVSGTYVITDGAYSSSIA